MVEQVQQVFRKVFQDEYICVTEKTSAKDIKMWDSLTHLELIAAIEEKFQLKFSFAEVMKFNTVGDMMEAIRQSLAKTQSRKGDE